MSAFEVIPAVDIRGGRCVRLLCGRFEEETVFSDDPVEAAKRWQDEGATTVHVVDLDGAREGMPVNAGVILDIIKKLSGAVQVGGGIRDTKAAQMYVEAGAKRVVVGTGAFTAPDWLREMVGLFAGQLVVGVDTRRGKVAIDGWVHESELTARQAVEQMADAGVRRIVYTDVSRDGTLEGPDLRGIEELAGVSRIPIIASGGVREVEDIEKIHRMSSMGVEGVIVGMALYRGSFTLAEAIEAATKGDR